MANKGIDSCFLHYGIRLEDMELIESACAEADIDSDWLKENILKPYNDEKINGIIEEKKVKSIVSKALKKISMERVQ